MSHSYHMELVKHSILMSLKSGQTEVLLSCHMTADFDLPVLIIIDLENTIGNKENTLKYSMPFLTSSFSKYCFLLWLKERTSMKKKARTFKYKSQNGIKLIPMAPLLAESSVCHDWIFDSADTGKASQLE